MPKMNWTATTITAGIVLALLYVLNILIAMSMPAYTPFAFDFTNIPKLLVTVLVIIVALAGRQYVKDSFNF